METLMNMFKLYPEEYGTEEAKILIFQDSNRSEKPEKNFWMNIDIKEITWLSESDKCQVHSQFCKCLIATCSTLGKLFSVSEQV